MGDEFIDGEHRFSVRHDLLQVFWIYYTIQKKISQDIAFLADKKYIDLYRKECNVSGGGHT